MLLKAFMNRNTYEMIIISSYCDYVFSFLLCDYFLMLFEYASLLQKNHRGFHRFQAVENRSVMGSSWREMQGRRRVSFGMAETCSCLSNWEVKIWREGLMVGAKSQGKQREQIWSPKDNWRDGHDPNENTSVKKKDVSNCLQGSRPGPREDKATRVPLWGTSCASSGPLLRQNCPSPPRLQSTPRPISSPPACEASAISQVSTHHCLLWMIRTQKPLENLSKIHALRIPHTECLILWPRLVDFPSQGACEWPESAASESVGLRGGRGPTFLKGFQATPTLLVLSTHWEARGYSRTREAVFKFRFRTALKQTVEEQSVDSHLELPLAALLAVRIWSPALLRLSTQGYARLVPSTKLQLNGKQQTLVPLCIPPSGRVRQNQRPSDVR